MDRISSRDPYRKLAEKWCCSTGAFRRCQDIHNNIETFLSPVGLQGSDNQTLHQPMQRICESSTEALSFVQKLISENLRLRQTLEKRMHIFPGKMDCSQEEKKHSRAERSSLSYADICRMDILQKGKQDTKLHNMDSFRAEGTATDCCECKPKQCWYYLRNKCHFGERCRNLHIRYNCKYFEENRCWFGNQCWNRHGKVKAMSEATQPPDANRIPRKTGTIMRN